MSDASKKLVMMKQLTMEAFTKNHPNEEHIPGVIYNPVEKWAYIKTLTRVNIGDWILEDAAGRQTVCPNAVIEMLTSVERPT